MSKVADIGLLRPATVPQVTVEVVKVVDKGIKILATLPQVITEIVDVGQVLPATLSLLITEDMLIDRDLGHKIPATLPLAIGRK